jgi:hypothetical protein
MGEAHEGCAVCRSQAGNGGRLSKVVIEGRALELCRAHAAMVVAAMPETFEDLRALFVGSGVDIGLVRERRSPIDRRVGQDRRVFPPRPEGRRRNGGRRAGDPLEG